MRYTPNRHVTLCKPTHNTVHGNSKRISNQQVQKFILGGNIHTYIELYGRKSILQPPTHWAVKGQLINLPHPPSSIHMQTELDIETAELARVPGA